MSKQYNQNNHQNNDVTTLTFDQSVIEIIASRAALAVDGVLAMQGTAFDKAKLAAKDVLAIDQEPQTNTVGVSAEVGQIEVAVDLDIVVEYGKNIPQINETIINNINQEITRYTGLKVVEVNVNVADIIKKEEYRRLHLKQIDQID